MGQGAGWEPSQRLLLAWQAEAARAALDSSGGWSGLLARFEPEARLQIGFDHGLGHHLGRRAAMGCDTVIRCRYDLDQSISGSPKILAQ